MTKVYTAAALVSLAEEGKIDLNAPTIAITLDRVAEARA